MTPQHSWHPDKEVIENSNIHKMMLQNGFNDYAEFWKWSASDKPEFWRQTLSNLGIRLKRKYDRIVDLSQGEERAQWIPGAQLNIVDSCFQNADDSTAVVFQEENGPLQRFSQKQLLEKVNRVLGKRIPGVLWTAR